MKTLSQAFAIWLDFDVAEFELAKCLGLMPNVPWEPKYKSLFWANNLFSTQLYNILEELVKMGALEMSGDDRQLRWNVAFDYTLTAKTQTDK